MGGGLESRCVGRVYGADGAEYTICAPSDFVQSVGIELKNSIPKKLRPHENSYHTE